MLKEIFFPYVYNQNLLLGVFLEITIILTIAIILKYFNKKKFSILFELLYEKVYLFYESILGEGEKKWIKTYIVFLFFMILISNMLGVALEFVAPVFGVDEKGEFIMEHYIKNPTVSLSFTLALSVSSIFMLLVVQFSKGGYKHFFLEYLPVFGKGYIFIERGNLNKYIFYVLNSFVKLFDIVLSLFISILEMLGLFAKVVSLAFRLFGNMISGNILVTIIIISLSVTTKELTSFLWGGFSFPIIFPIFIYLQEILIALVQAFVFPLLVSIFIKTTTAEG
ncbi:MAG: F0F1 ATP synthase subunit A [Candidatus Gracilibacteria bacterium]